MLRKGLHCGVDSRQHHDPRLIPGAPEPTRGEAAFTKIRYHGPSVKITLPILHALATPERNDRGFVGVVVGNEAVDVILRRVCEAHYVQSRRFFDEGTIACSAVDLLGASVVVGGAVGGCSVLFEEGEFLVQSFVELWGCIFVSMLAIA